MKKQQQTLAERVEELEQKLSSKGTEHFKDQPKALVKGNNYFTVGTKQEEVF